MKKATDIKTQWLFNLVGGPGLEPETSVMMRVDP
jgi:hypothetical protein